MYNIVFYEDKDGFSELNDELMKLAKKADSSKDARIQFKQITLYLFFYICLEKRHKRHQNQK